ncbi:MAG: nuclear transport factor 2 family protein, partial [Zoogloeaceae bacterium]|nr:nuclear transport factor 2 family protein [Zoogloeaceae bacterium]
VTPGAAATPPPAPPKSAPTTAEPGATKPAPVPGASASVPTADAQQVVAKTLADWIAAWARQDVKAYLAFYAPGFQPPKGVSRKEWEAERKERISRPAWIKITYDKPAITIDGNRASVRFRQHYKASSFKGDSEKTLALVRSGNRWLIADEDAR